MNGKAQRLPVHRGGGRGEGLRVLLLPLRRVQMVKQFTEATDGAVRVHITRRRERKVVSLLAESKIRSGLKSTED
jgi:hypothetical protein